MNRSGFIIAIIILAFGISIYWFNQQGQKRAELETGRHRIKEKAEGGEAMTINSSAFAENETIPQKFTCDGENVNPPLTFDNIPENAKSVVLIVDDPDAPAKVWSHWVVFNVPPTVTEIAENSVPQGAIQGKNDFGKTEYGGPCPPQGTAHGYRFKVYALDTELDLSSSATQKEVEEVIRGHVLGQGTLIGRYGR